MKHGWHVRPVLPNPAAHRWPCPALLCSEDERRPLWPGEPSGGPGGSVWGQLELSLGPRGSRRGRPCGRHGGGLLGEAKIRCTHVPSGARPHPPLPPAPLPPEPASLLPRFPGPAGPSFLISTVMAPPLQLDSLQCRSGSAVVLLGNPQGFPV